MDDLGSDQLCKLSCNNTSNKIERSAIYDNTATTPITDSSNSEDAISSNTINQNQVDDRLGNIRLINKPTVAITTATSATTTTTNHNDNAMRYNNLNKNSTSSGSPHMAIGATAISPGSHHYHHDRDSLMGDNEEDSYSPEDDEKEKTDATPENVKKIDDVIATAAFPNNDILLGGDGNCSSITANKKQTGVKNDDSYRSYSNDDDIELKIVEDESPQTKSQQCLAFTIEFSEGESSAASTAAAQARYKNMVERFQNRHRRGASLSKLDDSGSGNNSGSTTPISTASRPSRIMSQQQQKQHQKNEINSESESNKVKLRIKERSTSGVRDASKRHSWSPRSSSHEPLEQQQLQLQQKQNKSGSGGSKEKPSIPKGVIKDFSTNLKLSMKSSPSTKNTKKLVTDMPSRQPKNTHQHYLYDDDNNEKILTKTTTFKPRSTALQLALNKIEFICPEPPLDDFRQNPEGNEGDETVSETGTYTVDGDNYTEEQKELMNIDKTYVDNQDLISNNNQLRPNELSLHHNHNKKSSVTNDDGVIENPKRNNILEINYYHDSTSLKPKVSYLEKIKSKVRSVAKSPAEKKSNSSTDVGVFTSVTTSGVLSIKPTLDSHPKVTRRNSLTKSHVDSSEYVSTVAAASAITSLSDKGSSGDKKKDSTTYQLPFTDHQKAEYKLNLFTATTVNQTDSQILNENYVVESSDMSTPITPDSPSNSSFTKSIISETGLQKAQSKNDWIQEWARNARARSQSATTTNNSVSSGVVNTTASVNEQMSRSYNFDSTSTEFMGNAPLYRNGNNKATTIVDHHRFHHRMGIGDFDYSSDPNVSVSVKNGQPQIPLNSRPPISPSKIPSPMHTVGRARSVSRTRSNLQDLSPTTAKSVVSPPSDISTDIYLQETADAISNLTQLSRKNSFHSSPNATTTVKSPPSVSSAGNSPRHHVFSQHYSADEYSPTHTANASSHHRHYQHNNGQHHHLSHANVHKRNLSLDYRNNLMSNSLNTETLASMLTNQQGSSTRSRQHSYDSNITMGSRGAYESPKLFQRKAYIDQTGTLVSTKQVQSPIRRSSSFSTKPISRGGDVSSNNGGSGSNSTSKHHQQTTTSNIQRNPIQKSASSSSFRKMYSDYDDNIAYYINDEDDLVDAEYYGSSDDYDEINSDYISSSAQKTVVELTEPPVEPLTKARSNKALLMRIERSKQRATGLQNNTSKATISRGVIACPNTPEMPRRAVQSATRSSIRQSVPRDSSLNRLKAEMPNSLASAKQLFQTAAAATTSSTPTTANQSKKVQPKYMDISKYKPVQGANFLRKDETKSTLMTRSTEIKRSPSSASVSLNRNDPIRASNRSAKSSSSRPGSSSSKREPPSGIVQCHFIKEYV